MFLSLSRSRNDTSTGVTSLFTFEHYRFSRQLEIEIVMEIQRFLIKEFRRTRKTMIISKKKMNLIKGVIKNATRTSQIGSSSEHYRREFMETGDLSSSCIYSNYSSSDEQVLSILCYQADLQQNQFNRCMFMPRIELRSFYSRKKKKSFLFFQAAPLFLSFPPFYSCVLFDFFHSPMSL